MKLLFFSPVGRSARPLVSETVARFAAAGADFRLVQYEDTDLALPAGIPVLRDSGAKWQLARRHLHPDSCADYDYLFVWDDDLAIADFDPARFTAIMAANRLDMAQPALRSAHGLAHALTRQRERTPEMHAAGIVGRLTNFVEIMAPVFSREGWAQFHAALDDANRSGYGYDYLPLAPRGIVDSMHLVHTRPVQSPSDAAWQEMAQFLAQYGLFRYPHIELGWLFALPPEGSAPAPVRSVPQPPGNPPRTFEAVGKK